MKKFTIQVFYDAKTDAGKIFRATSVYQTEAENVGEAYENANRDMVGEYKFGACLPGHHNRFP